MEELTRELTKEAVEEMLTDIEEIHQRRGVTQKEKNRIWQRMAAFGAYQSKEQKGLFFDAVKDFLKP